MNIHQKINYRMMNIVRDYYMTWQYFELRANDCFPSNLKHGGFRNTCFDYRK